MHKHLPPDEYYKTIAKVPTSGGALFQNKKGEFLILKQSYREGWHISGGISDIHESPREAVLREVKEELGITITQARLFCIDFSKSNPFDRVLFVFDCGILDENMIKMIKIDNDEITAFKFVPYEEMIESLGVNSVQQRIKNSIESFKNGGITYLENGAPI